jgi:type IV pilus assembly protein PilC
MRKTGVQHGKNPTKKLGLFTWEAKDGSGKLLRGELRASSPEAVRSNLRQRGMLPLKVAKLRVSSGKKISSKDVSIFTRQLATMMKAGIPLLKSFEIVAQGHSNPAVTKLLLEIKSSIEEGNTLAKSFSQHPKHFNSLFCNLIEAGENAGILEDVLDRLATYSEKTDALKSRIKSALFYPIAIIGVAFAITALIMIFVIPAFKSVFASFGADLPAPTLMLMGASDFVVANWYLIFGAIGGAIYGLLWSNKNVPSVHKRLDRVLLRLPIFGKIIEKAIIARWARTLATMFAAGMPLVQSLSSVGGAAGNDVYQSATVKVQGDVSAGGSLTSAMESTGLFPTMVTQMVSIGEESGALDDMLGKVAGFYEDEVDQAVDTLSSLMEPLIMVILGTLIGGMVVAMYLPIFKLGAAAGG